MSLVTPYGMMRERRLMKVEKRRRESLSKSRIEQLISFLDPRLLRLLEQRIRCVNQIIDVLA